MKLDERRDWAHRLRIGGVVRLTWPREAYYSNRNGNPRVEILAGEVGVVGAVRVAAVTEISTEEKASLQAGGHYVPPCDWFTCVDFVVPGVYNAGTNATCIWRVAAYYDQILPTDPVSGHRAQRDLLMARNTAFGGRIMERAKMVGELYRLAGLRGTSPEDVDKGLYDFVMYQAVRSK